MFGSKSHIGSGFITINDFIHKINEKNEITIQLTHHSKVEVQQGTVTLNIIMIGQLMNNKSINNEKTDNNINILKQKNEKISDKLSQNPNDKLSDIETVSMNQLLQFNGPIIMKLMDLKATNLLDTGSTRDPQDPKLKIKIGNNTFETKRFVYFISFCLSVFLFVCLSVCQSVYEFVFNLNAVCLIITFIF